MRTLWATTTGNAGPGMLAWGSWSMMSILAVPFSGTLRTACLDLSQHWAGMKALCLSTAKTIQIFCSTCVALNAAFFPSAARHLKNSPIGMVYGTYKMRYKNICIAASVSFLYPRLNQGLCGWKTWTVRIYNLNFNWKNYRRVRNASTHFLHHKIKLKTVLTKLSEQLLNLGLGKL